MGLVEIVVSNVGNTVRSADRDICFSIGLFYQLVSIHFTKFLEETYR